MRTRNRVDDIAVQADAWAASHHRYFFPGSDYYIKRIKSDPKFKLFTYGDLDDKPDGLQPWQLPIKPLATIVLAQRQQLFKDTPVSYLLAAPVSTLKHVPSGADYLEKSLMRIVREQCLDTYWADRFATAHGLNPFTVWGWDWIDLPRPVVEIANAVGIKPNTLATGLRKINSKLYGESPMVVGQTRDGQKFLDGVEAVEWADWFTQNYSNVKEKTELRRLSLQVSTRRRIKREREKAYTTLTKRMQVSNKAEHSELFS